MYVTAGFMGLIMLVPIVYAVCNCEFFKNWCYAKYDTGDRREKREDKMAERRAKQPPIYGSAV